MRVLSYSPSVMVYAAHVGDGQHAKTEYIDLSPDVVRASVSRKQNATSTATVTLANEGGKYDGLFLPFDVVAIEAIKSGSPVRLFTGYVTKAPVSRVYGGNAEISCSDCIYRLQRLFFDPELEASKRAMGYGQSSYGDPAKRIRDTLVNIGGLSLGEITIGGMPSSVIEWAKGLYAAQVNEAMQSAQMLQQIYDLLEQATPTISGGTSSGGLVADDSQLGEGESIDIPEPYGAGGYTVTLYGPQGWVYADGSTAAVASGTNQYLVWQAWVGAGATYDNGIACLDGRYLCACTSTFGMVGDRITWELDDGTTIPTIMADEKSQTVESWDANPANKWGHGGGQNVLEFEVSRDWYLRYGNPGGSEWMPQWGGRRVCRATNYGSML